MRYLPAADLTEEFRLFAPMRDGIQYYVEPGATVRVSGVTAPAAAQRDASAA